MDLDISAPQQAILDRVTRFAREQVAPAARAIDAEGVFPLALVRAAFELGLAGVTIPKELGGGGSDYVAYALAVEAIARASATVAVIVAVQNSLVSEPIARFGTDAQKEACLRRLAEGRTIGAFALSEANAGSDAANQQTLARSDGGGFILNGRKVWVANAEAAELAIVFAATQPGAGGRGVSAFLVPMDAPGVKRLAAADSLGVRGLGCMDLELDGRPCRRFDGARRRRRRIPRRAVGARRRPHRDRRAGARRRPGGARRGARARQSARGVRPADRELPGDPVDARRHGNRAGCRPDAHAQGG